MTSPIEKNIPIPENRGAVARWPWKDMEVGDSFFMPNGKKKTASPLAHTSGIRLGMKFTVREVDGGVRVWRTA